MEARATEKKLTRRERLDKYNVPDQDIPEEFKDTGLTFDIMEEAGEVDGKILDLAVVKRWQHEKLSEALKKNPPPTTEEIHQISQINAFTTIPFKTYKFLKELDQQIEAWVCSQEKTYAFFEVLRQQRKEKDDRLKKLAEAGTFIEQEINSLQALLDDTQDEQEENELLNRLALILHKKERLPEKKDKILQAKQYYSDPVIINHKIVKLADKLKCPTLTQEEKNKTTEKLHFWTQRLEARTARSNSIIRPRSATLGLFGLEVVLQPPLAAHRKTSPQLLSKETKEEKKKLPRLSHKADD